MGIYKITNLKNGKVYVGSAKDIWHRKLEHIRELKGGFHANRHLQYAYNKYGDDAFIHEDLEEVMEEKNLLKRELYKII